MDRRGRGARQQRVHRPDAHLAARARGGRSCATPSGNRARELATGEGRRRDVRKPAGAVARHPARHLLLSRGPNAAGASRSQDDLLIADQTVASRTKVALREQVSPSTVSPDP